MRLWKVSALKDAFSAATLSLPFSPAYSTAINVHDEHDGLFALTEHSHIAIVEADDRQLVAV